uniref:Seven TM Receptor n=1 Tax=Caenorhabditis tropicalis TaxID=1561998 RepID=A0A1I7TC90_9PELO
MRIEAFESLKTLIQLISCAFAITLNSLLIFLIIKKSPKKMGTYRNLMCYFCGISLVFTLLDVIVKPDIYSRGSAFFMVMDLRNRFLPRWIDEFLMSLLCGCCGMTMHGIAIHFVYSYFALERPMIEEVYGIPISNAAYSAAVFWPNGIGDFHWRSGFGLLNIFISFSMSLLVVIVMGLKSWRMIKQLLGRLESRFSKNLQMQLCKALVVQTLIPVLFMFIPFGILFTCPLLLINCEFLSAPITIIYAVYPALDPLPCLFFVDNYRNWISGVFSRRNKSKVSVVMDDQVTKNIYSI